MLVAEELDADWSKVRVEQAAINPVYANVTALGDSAPAAMQGAMMTTARLIGVQMTGGSTSTRDAWEPMRAAAASARAMLLAAAGAKWNVNPADLQNRQRRNPPRGLGPAGYAGRVRTNRRCAAATTGGATETAQRMAPAWYQPGPPRRAGEGDGPRPVRYRCATGRAALRGDQASAGDRRRTAGSALEGRHAAQRRCCIRRVARTGSP